ncbi:L,D-transpeptidase [Thermomonospora cellulosilytica]|uniref:L,D-transpeptidase n=1 Tax=Thermomonospora cellulosilytica TaxID=1411118 RepID=UPI0028B1B0A2|nr:L,D-transpeptidase [Thermomonospora cellulosilytica]
MTHRSQRVIRRAPAASRAAGRRSRGLVAGFGVAVVYAALVSGCGGGQQERTRPAAAVDLAGLPQATTFTTLRGLPRDPAPAAPVDGTVVHPTTALPVAAEPGGRPVAALPDKQLDGPTWVPVLETRQGWHRVMLPSKPNQTTGWIPQDGGRLTTARTPYQVKVEVGARRLTIVRDGRKVGAWTVAVGAEKTPTPVGRTFVLALLKPTKPTFSPLVVPVGAHSETLDTFGGGPGTVAFHGWKDESVFGKAVTHGCIRVPADALERLSEIPLGTPVHVTA